MSSDQLIDPESDSTGLPGLQSWRAVYLLVSGIFVVYVVVLAALSRAFT